MFNLLYETIVKTALIEDTLYGDVTSESLISPDREGVAIIKSKDTGILAGTEISALVFKTVDSKLKVEFLLEDGSKLSKENLIARIEGKLLSILKAERVALNFLQHLSGVATQTYLFVKAVKGLPVKIADTRKTIPGLRLLEKKAVISGGGINHRMHLADSILIKNNHIKVCRKEGMNIKEIIEKAKRNNLFITKPIEIEVNTVEEAIEAMKAGADIIMLDNMSIENIRQAVLNIKGHAIIEASGGVNLDNIRAIAETGVDIISIGNLTHSAKALDIHLLIE